MVRRVCRHIVHDLFTHSHHAMQYALIGFAILFALAVVGVVISRWMRLRNGEFGGFRDWAKKTSIANTQRLTILPRAKR